MRVLLVGGNGFLGSHIADKLVAAGVTVRILDVTAERFRAPLDGVEYIYGSFFDSGVLQSALEQVDLVCHLASTTVPATAAANPVKDVRENLLGTLSLLEVMKDRKIRRLIFVSSGGTVYGNPDTLPIPETHPLRPRTSYGIVKAATEAFLGEMERSGQLRPLIFRISNPYGPRQSLTGVQGVIASFLGRIKSGEPVDLWGDGTVIRDFVFVEDVADLFVRATFSSTDCGVFNVGSGEGVSLNDLLSVIQGTVCEMVQVRYHKGRPFDVPANYLAIDEARRNFGWEAATSLQDGLAATWKWLNELPPSATNT